MCISVPYVLSWVGERVITRQHVFIYIWIVYIAALLGTFFYWKRKTFTVNSFSTHLLTWAIFTLGSYVLVDMPRFLPPHLRQVVLYLWCSFTMPFNFVFFLFDDTDYKEEERKEKIREEKEKKKEQELEKRRELQRQRNLQWWLKLPKSVRYAINMAIYGAVLYFVWHYGNQYYEEFYRSRQPAHSWEEELRRQESDEL